jgi:hypothetical protein
MQLKQFLLPKTLYSVVEYFFLQTIIMENVTEHNVKTCFKKWYLSISKNC